MSAKKIEPAPVEAPVEVPVEAVDTPVEAPAHIDTTDADAIAAAALANS